VLRIFGGEVSVRSTFVQHVNTRYEPFQVEIDTSILKDKKYERPLRAVGVDPERKDVRWLENALLGIASTVVPIEIGTPPIPIDELAGLDELRVALKEAGAKGTRASVFYAFGMHINPEVPTDDPGVLRDYLRAFVLLYPWLKQRVEVDFTRAITPYINKFPSEYARLILQPDYPATHERLIEDYLYHNLTRNRPLDMLPLWAWVDRERVMARVEEGHLVKPRPSFHYRLPNCLVDEPHWSVAREWNTWVAVERLAKDPERIAAMSRDYLAAEEESFRPFYEKWPRVLEQYVSA
jgi:hypothetical protein